DGIRDFHVTGVQTCALPISIVGAGDGRALRVVASTASELASFEGAMDAEGTMLQGPLSTINAAAVREMVPALRPQLVGLRTSARSEERRVGKERSCRVWAPA